MLKWKNALCHRRYFKETTRPHGNCWVSPLTSHHTQEQERRHSPSPSREAPLTLTGLVSCEDTDSSDWDRKPAAARTRPGCRGQFARTWPKAKQVMSRAVLRLRGSLEQGTVCASSGPSPSQLDLSMLEAKVRVWWILWEEAEREVVCGSRDASQ